MKNIERFYETSLNGDDMFYWKFSSSLQNYLLLKCFLSSHCKSFYKIEIVWMLLSIDESTISQTFMGEVLFHLTARRSHLKSFNHSATGLSIFPMLYKEWINHLNRLIK